MPVSCPVPSEAGSHNLTVTSTYSQGAACGSSPGTVTAQTSVLVQPRPTVTLAPVGAASVPVCSRTASVTLEFAYTTTAPSANEPLQLEPRVTAGVPTACTVVQQGGRPGACLRRHASPPCRQLGLTQHPHLLFCAAGTTVAGKLVVTCSGAFHPQAGPVAVTASLTATTLSGCATTSTATATITPVCCTDAVASARGGASSQCFEHIDPSNLNCRSRPQISRFGFYQQGELAAGELQSGVASGCSTGGRPVVGSVSAQCRVADKALVFSVTTKRGSSPSIRWWAGCSRPAAVTAGASAARVVAVGIIDPSAPPEVAVRDADGRRVTGRHLLQAPGTCNLWRVLPAPGPANTVELSVTTQGDSVTTSWVWKPSTAASRRCTCSDVFWAVSASGTFVDASTDAC